jgi:hypothetical protein
MLESAGEPMAQLKTPVGHDCLCLLPNGIVVLVHDPNTDHASAEASNLPGSDNRVQIRHSRPFSLKAFFALSALGGMDQGSDFISDFIGDFIGDFISEFRARRIRTQITWENLSADRHEVTVTYLKPVPPHTRGWLRHCQCRRR